MDIKTSNTKTCLNKFLFLNIQKVKYEYSKEINRSIISKSNISIFLLRLWILKKIYWVRKVG